MFMSSIESSINVGDIGDERRKFAKFQSGKAVCSLTKNYKVTNRRLRKMSLLMEEGYFSLKEIALRDPALYSLYFSTMPVDQDNHIKVSTDYSKSHYCMQAIMLYLTC